jgi:hypothetical protein
LKPMFLWDRQDGESEKAHAAFLHYRDLPKGERTINKVAAELGKSTALLYKWYARWTWAARVAAWDESLLTEVDAELLEAQKEHRKHVHESAVSLRNKVIQELEGRDLTGLSYTELLTAFDALVKHDRAALGMDGRGGGPGGQGGTGAPSAIKLYVGVDIDRV